MIRSLSRFAGLLMAGAMLLPPAPAIAQTAVAADDVAYPVPTFGGWGFNPADLDRTMRPGADFWSYVNGNWAKTDVIPAEYPRSGISLALHLQAQRAVRAIIDELRTTPQAPGSIGAKLAASYDAFTDTRAIEAAGMAPAKPWLDRIRQAGTREQMAALMGAPEMPDPIVLRVGIDPFHTEANTVFASIGGMGLPDRGYYLTDTVRNVELRAKYKAYLTMLLTRAGESDAEAMAGRVYEFERQIALVAWDRAIKRNPLLVNTVVPADRFAGWGGDFGLQPMLAASGLAGQSSLIVAEVPPAAGTEIAGLSAEDRAKLGGGMPALAQLLATTDIATLKAWMIAHFLDAHAAELPAAIDDARFELYGKTLSGQERQPPRWQRAIDTVEGQMGEALGKLYVERHFPPASKAAVERLVANLRTALAANLRANTWMTPATRTAALEKLAQFHVKIGYPDRFKTYDGMVMRADAPLANAIESDRWHWQDGLRELAEGVDRGKWLMTPQTFNAYYNPPANEIVFPAAILQPPMFNPHADDAVNYGAIGAVIGHEIGHGFDDQGSRYDGSGRLHNWWSDADRATFERLTHKLVAQYDAICPFDGGKTCHNGRLTLGENIGDLGGLAMAYQAYHLSLHGKPAKVIDGLTGDQRFFIAYAQSWRDRAREAFARRQLQTNPHALADARVNGAVRNFDPWYKAFDVKPGDALYLPPDQRVRIW